MLWHAERVERIALEIVWYLDALEERKIHAFHALHFLGVYSGKQHVKTQKPLYFQ